MLETKMIEIRDRATCIPAMAVRLNGYDATDRAFLDRAGFRNSDEVYLIQLSTGQGNYDPFKWDYSRTMTEAHLYIKRNYNALISGQVVDVRVILGEEPFPANPEIDPNYYVGG